MKIMHTTYASHRHQKHYQPIIFVRGVDHFLPQKHYAE